MGEVPIWILFVCLGNTCRSPVAMALAEEMWGDKVIVSSAGVSATDGNAATEQGAISIGCLDLSDDAKERVVTRLRTRHKSRFIETALKKDRPDVIVALTEKIGETLTFKHNIPSAKIVVLGVEDPYVDGQPADPLRYEAATRGIHSALLRLEAEIFSTARNTRAQPPPHER